VSTLTWILASALARSAVAWVGLWAAALKEAQLKALLRWCTRSGRTAGNGFSRQQRPRTKFLTRFLSAR
jgi:hypothetical protein